MSEIGNHPAPEANISRAKLPFGAAFHTESRTVSATVLQPERGSRVRICVNSSGGTSVSLSLRLDRALSLHVALTRAVEHLKREGIVTDADLARPRLTDAE